MASRTQKSILQLVAPVNNSEMLVCRAVVAPPDSNGNAFVTKRDEHTMESNELGKRLFEKASDRMDTD